MAPWCCNVHVSWRTQVIALLGYGALVLTILLAPGLRVMASALSGCCYWWW
ncbi:hypothetical protein CRM76_06765 [Edwardsiella tarda]|uniref:Uncharacterized protein n=1 Tax=Edwardsiella tarda TaxID=636 RepID=A0A2A7U040_EDWTA|nr:hypothetical protein CRM76_06765 [Edwardsiella tarda]